MIEDKAPSHVIYKTVTADSSGQRLDNYIFSFIKHVPKSRVHKAIRKGEVRINGKRAAFSDRLVEHDVVRLPPQFSTAGKAHTPSLDSAKKLYFKADVLYEDASVMVLNKPDHLPVHAGSGFAKGVCELLKEQHAQTSLYLAHRLDLPVSGCLLFAKSRNTLHSILDNWHNPRCEKSYQALVFRSEIIPVGNITISLTKNDDTLHYAEKDCETTISPNAKLFSNNKELALLDVCIATGRNHQIRKHLSLVKTPVVGDDKYGHFDLNRVFSRTHEVKGLFLHCNSLCYYHPERGWHTITAPWPTQKESCLQHLQETG